MEKNGYPAVNSEMIIFMKRQGNDFIIHGLFVDDMMHVPTRDALKHEFMGEYTRDFNITGQGLMETFLGTHAATWVRFDLSFAVAQLARFCASVGKSHWAALHHLMEYLQAQQSFKLT